MDCNISGMISVIVPVYKTESYLAKCIDSILNQTYTNLEVILVDDGSPDEAGVICDQYAQKDSRVRVIHQANQGVSAARNTGLAVANGEYISFIDSDDWIDPFTYQEVIADIESHQTDGVFFGLNRIDEENNIIDVWSSKQSEVVDNLTAIRLMYGMAETPTHGCGPCNKLFRKSVLEKYRFTKDLCVGEDALFFTEVILACRWIYLNSNAYYQYLQHTESASHQPELSRQKMDRIRAWQRMAEVVKSDCKQLYRKARANVFRYGVLMTYYAYLSEKSIPKDLREMIAACWRDYLFCEKKYILGRLKYMVTYIFIRLHVSKTLVSYVFNMSRNKNEG